jgi:uncharacterized protein (TIGR03435 family)
LEPFLHFERKLQEDIPMTIRTLSLLGLTLLLFDAGMRAQEPSFAVASIKPSGAPGPDVKGGERETVNFGPDSVTLSNVSVKRCIQLAWSLADYQVLGPSWLDTQRLNIAAKADSAVPEAQLRLMLRTLLAARMNLVQHSETRELPVFEMTVAKNGHHLQKSAADGDAAMRFDGGTLVFQNMTMEQLARRMTAIPFRLTRPALDRTELPGPYDFRLKVADSIVELKRGLEQADEGYMIEIIQSQLGLKMTP